MADEQAAGMKESLHGSSSLSSGACQREGRGGPATLTMAVSDDGIRRALQQDQGSDAHLVSWSRQDFTKKGDNYVAEVTSVSVKYRLDTTCRNTSYVVKMRRGPSGSHFDDMAFVKEGRFYTVVLPLLNSELKTAGQEPLRVPRCLHTTWDDHESQLFMEDLRLRDFKMYNRKKPLSVAHAILTIRELARLHAASVLLLSRLPREGSPLSFLSWDMSNYSQQTTKSFEKLISGSLQTASEVAGVAGRKDMQEWFSNLAPRGPALLIALARLASPFDVIGHGDCWINNILFREDSEGNPVEVMMLDFQLCRRYSPALDLNYLLFTSLTAAQRSTNLTHMLDAYYSSFQAVLTAAGHVPPFTLEHLTQEFHAKIMFGLVYGALSIPALVCDDSDAQEFEFSAASEDQTGDYVNKKRQRCLQMLSSKPLMRPRLLSLYEDVSRHALDTTGHPDTQEYLPGKSVPVSTLDGRENHTSP